MSAITFGSFLRFSSTLISVHLFGMETCACCWVVVPTAAVLLLFGPGARGMRAVNRRLRQRFSRMVAAPLAANQERLAGDDPEDNRFIFQWPFGA